MHNVQQCWYIHTFYYKWTLKDFLKNKRGNVYLNGKYYSSQALAVAALNVTNGGEGRGGTRGPLTTPSTRRRKNIPQIRIERIFNILGIPQKIKKI